MKTKIFFIVFFSLIALKAQSTLIIGSNASLDVQTGADICSDSLSGTVTGNGTFCENPTEVESETDKKLLTEYALEQNYPNPFNPRTVITWQSPVSGHQTLKVYDVLSKEVATIVDEFKSAGTYEVDFNAINLPSGVYFYKLQIGNFISTKKMTLIK